MKISEGMEVAVIAV